MAGDVPDWISKTSNTLGLWTIVGIIAFLVIFWRSISYVYHLRDARRGRIQSIQDEIRLLRGLDSDLDDGAFSHLLHNSILDQERRLDNLSQTKVSLWVGISALFRPDPCLRLLEELEADSRQIVQRMTIVRLVILRSYNARQTEQALPSAGHMSSPQTFEAEPTRQPAESTFPAFSSGHSTTIGSMARTGNLRHRVPTPPPAISTEDARQLIEDYIKGSTWYQTDMMEPSVGDVGVPACALLLARSGGSIYLCFVDTRKDHEGSTEHYCIACGFKSGRLDRLIEHQRSKRGHLQDERDWEGLLQEMWYMKQEEEPSNHLGQSILFRWLNHFETEERKGWSCCVPLGGDKRCTYTSVRPDHAIAHVRDHLGLKPYLCEGKCGNQDCTACFSSKDDRMAHYHEPSANIPVSILQRLAPAEGPVSGGVTILFSGINFPPPYQQPVYARFGSMAVPTTWHNPHTLECNLPPTPTPGTVTVSLSLSPEPGAPELGQSDCLFQYKLEIDYLHALLRQLSGEEKTLTPENWDSMIPHFVQNVSPTGRAMLSRSTRISHTP